MSGTCLNKLSRPSKSASMRIPLFLAPAFANSFPQFLPANTSRTFTITPSAQSYRKQTREKNKNRGVSAIRRTGPRVPLSISRFNLPRPVRDSQRRNDFQTSPDHGLWGFFNDAKAPMIAPEDEDAHGRPWTYQELDWKTWEQLHALYWVCVKERNQISTRTKERKRLKAGYGDYEADGRISTVSTTMRRIRQVLIDRYDLREDARALMDTKTAVQLLAEEAVLQPGEEELEEEVDEAEEQAIGKERRTLDEIAPEPVLVARQ